MPDYTLDTHTKPHGFRVGNFENVRFSKYPQMLEQLSAIVLTNGTFTAMLPSEAPDAVRQHISNGVNGNGLTIVSDQQIAPYTIIGIVDSALHRT